MHSFIKSPANSWQQKPVGRQVFMLNLGICAATCSWAFSVQYCTDTLSSVLAWEQWTPGAAGHQSGSFHDSEEGRHIGQHLHVPAADQRRRQSTKKLDSTGQLSSVMLPSPRTHSNWSVCRAAGPFPAVLMFAHLTQPDTDLVTALLSFSHMLPTCTNLRCLHSFIVWIKEIILQTWTWLLWDDAGVRKWTYYLISSVLWSLQKFSFSV